MQRQDVAAAERNACELDEARPDDAVGDILRRMPLTPDCSDTAEETTAKHVEALCASPQFLRFAEQRQYGPAGTQLQWSNIEAVTAHLQLCKVRSVTSRRSRSLLRCCLSCSAMRQKTAKPAGKDALPDTSAEGFCCSRHAGPGASLECCFETASAGAHICAGDWQQACAAQCSIGPIDPRALCGAKSVSLNRHAGCHERAKHRHARTCAGRG